MDYPFVAAEKMQIYNIFKSWKGMKKNYQNPEVEVVTSAMEKEILSESYNYGGGGTYSGNDIIDNGLY